MCLLYYVSSDICHNPTHIVDPENKFNTRHYCGTCLNNPYAFVCYLDKYIRNLCAHPNIDPLSCYCPLVQLYSISKPSDKSLEKAEFQSLYGV